MLPNMPPSCSARYPSTSSPWILHPVLAPQHGVCYLSSPLISNAGMDFCLGSSPPTSARQGMNSRISLWLQVLHLHLGSQAPGPGSHSPDQHSCLSLSYFKSIRGGPLVTKITYRILPLSASTGNLL